MSTSAIPAALPARVTRTRAFGRSLTLLTIGLVVVLVSLPRLRDFALRENESDARALSRLLAVSLSASDAPTIQGLLSAAPNVARLANDREFLAGGELLRRHGYLFDLARASDGRRAVRAWPWSAGRTGRRAFIAVAAGELWSGECARGHWSGPAGAPDVAALGNSPSWSVERRAE